MGNSEIKPNLEVESLSTVLKTARLEKDITIDYIVLETRISKHVIEQIEAENPKNLPEPVFLKGFLKAYAKIVGLDPAEIIKLYQAEHGIIEDASRDKRGKCLVAGSMPQKKRSYKLPVFIAIVVFAVGGMSLLNTHKPTDNNDISVIVQGTENVNVTVQQDQKQIIDYKLEIVCVEETTLKISTDGEQVVEYTMNPEEHLELKAKENFNILITNTCGVTLFLNDKVIDVPGKCGQTVNMQLP